jgi:hypothetical protein
MKKWMFTKTIKIHHKLLHEQKQSRRLNRSGSKEIFLLKFIFVYFGLEMYREVAKSTQNNVKGVNESRSSVFVYVE